MRAGRLTASAVVSVVEWDAIAIASLLVDTTLRDAFYLAGHYAAVLVGCAGCTTGATVLAVYFDACTSTV